MAANHARRTLLSSSSSATVAFLSGRVSSFSTVAKLSGFASARLSRKKPSFLSRLPVELGCSQSLMPLHSVTASSLLTSKLSLKAGNWGWLSEGFATPL